MSNAQGTEVTDETESKATGFGYGSSDGLRDRHSRHVPPRGVARAGDAPLHPARACRRQPRRGTLQVPPGTARGGCQGPQRVRLAGQGQRHRPAPRATGGRTDLARVEKSGGGAVQSDFARRKGDSSATESSGKAEHLRVIL